MRTDAVFEKRMFKAAWLKPWHCNAPRQAIYGADWRSGQHVPMRFTEADHWVLGLVGLWCPWQDPTTLEWENTFAAPTINADEHPLFGLMQQADEERGMPVILLAGQYGALLDAPPVRSSAFMRRFRRRLWG